MFLFKSGFPNLLPSFRELNAAFSEANELLTVAYAAELRHFASLELQDPRTFAAAISSQRANLLPRLPALLDFLILKAAGASELQELRGACRIARQLQPQPTTHALLLLRRWSTARVSGNSQMRAFFALGFTEAALRAGAIPSATAALTKAEEALEEGQEGREGLRLRAEGKWRRAQLITALRAGKTEVRKAESLLREATMTFQELDDGEDAGLKVSLVRLLMKQTQFIFLSSHDSLATCMPWLKLTLAGFPHSWNFEILQFPGKVPQSKHRVFIRLKD